MLSSRLLQRNVVDRVPTPAPLRMPPAASPLSTFLRICFGVACPALSFADAGVGRELDFRGIHSLRESQGPTGRPEGENT